VFPDAAQPGQPQPVGTQLQDLQRLANVCGQMQSTAQVLTRIQILYVSGVEAPWRMVESDQSIHSGNYYSRWMFVFDDAEQLRRTLLERAAWQQADLRFQEENMSTPGGFPGVTTDLVPTDRFDLVFATVRAAIKEEICVTTPQRTVRLKGRGGSHPLE
jgi:hypothetical protein